LQIDVHHSRRKWTRRLTMLAPTALFGAFVEELLFRGVVMADLLRTPALNPVGGVLMATAVFAGAHYVRSVKRHWTLPGHVMLGLLLCIAFQRTGQLWLAAGLHAGGIMMIMAARPFVRYRGPAWLTGASIFPFAGVVGIAGLGILTVFVATHFGAPSAWP
jgi:membrane protease YdiL (CAAX protease family)